MKAGSDCLGGNAVVEEKLHLYGAASAVTLSSLFFPDVFPGLIEIRERRRSALVGQADDM